MDGDDENFVTVVDVRPGDVYHGQCLGVRWHDGIRLTAHFGVDGIFHGLEKSDLCIRADEDKVTLFESLACEAERKHRDFDHCINPSIVVRRKNGERRNEVLYHVYQFTVLKGFTTSEKTHRGINPETGLMIKFDCKWHVTAGAIYTGITRLSLRDRGMNHRRSDIFKDQNISDLKCVSNLHGKLIAEAAEWRIKEKTANSGISCNPDYLRERARSEHDPPLIRNKLEDVNRARKRQWDNVPVPYGPCPACNRTFRGKQFLARHLRDGCKPVVVPPENRFQCDMCDNKPFSYLRGLHQHIRLKCKNRETRTTKHGFKDSCGRWVWQQQDPTDRVALRKCKEKFKLREKAFICTWPGCEWRFNIRRDLERHMPTHTGIRAFNCKRCPMTYYRKDQLALHVKNKH